MSQELFQYFVAMVLTPAIYCAVLGLFWLVSKAKERVFG